jgi:hypothetical protein
VKRKRKKGYRTFIRNHRTESEPINIFHFYSNPRRSKLGRVGCGGKDVFEVQTGGQAGPMHEIGAMMYPGNSKGGSIIVPLTSCLTVLESAV